MSCCAGSHRISIPPPIGGRPARPGSRLLSAMPGWWRSGVPEDSLQSFPEAFREGMAARADQLLDYGENDPKHWEQPSAAERSTSGSASSAIPKRSGTHAHGDGAAAVPGTLGRHRAHDAGLRRPAGRPQPARLQGLASASPPSRAAASSRCPVRDNRSKLASSSSAILARPACRFRCHSRTCWDATAPSSACANTSRGSGRSTASCQANAQTRRGAGAARGEAGGALAQRRAVRSRRTQDDPALGADPQRNNDFTYANDPHGWQVPLGSHMRRMNPRDTELAQLTDVNLHRIIRRGTTYGAPYDPNATSRARRRSPARDLLHLHQRQGDGHDGVPATGVDQQRQFHEPGRRTRSDTSGCRRTGRRSRSRRSRSGAASTASRRSTCFAAASTSSCPAVSALRWLGARRASE